MRETMASLRDRIATLEVQLTAAKNRNYDECPLGDLSMALLQRIDNLKSEQQDKIDTAESDMEKLDNAYADADSADDRVRELNLNDD